MKAIKKLNQTGDTIIEVLVVLAVLSMSFGISYATASRSLNGSLNAEEHSEALGILDTQLEDLRIAVATHPNGFPPTGAFCMTSTNSFSNLNSAVPPTSLADSQGHWAEYGSCTFSTYYHVSVEEVNPALGTTYNSYTTPIATYCTSGTLNSCKEDSFTFMVRWDGVGNLGPQQESLTYRFSTDNLNAGVYSRPEVYVPPVPILAILREIPLTGPTGTTSDPEPSCSAPATSGMTGASVTLTGPSYTNTQASVAGNAEFGGLTNNNTYTATVSSTTLPPGYQLCLNGTPASNGNPASALLGSAKPVSTSPNPLVIDACPYKSGSSCHVTVRPVCTSQQVTRITGWNPVYTEVITGWNPVYTYELTQITANYAYAWEYIGTWYTNSNTTYIGVYAKYNNTTPGPGTLGWIAWQDPYKSGGSWAWPFYQVYDYVSSYNYIYGYVLTGWTPVYTNEITGWTPVYTTETIYNCP